MRIAAIIRENLTELALIDTLDMGKPISEAVNVDVPGSATFFQWHAEAIDKLYDEVAPPGGRDVAMIRRVPQDTRRSASLFGFGNHNLPGAWHGLQATAAPN